jgi:hypothetical protein
MPALIFDRDGTLVRDSVERAKPAPDLRSNSFRGFVVSCGT